MARTALMFHSAVAFPTDFTSIAAAAAPFVTATSVVALVTMLAAEVVLRKKERSLKDAIVGEADVSMRSILRILKEFKTDESRLQALKLVVHKGDRVNEMIVERAKKYDVQLLEADRRTKAVQYVAAVGGVFLAFGIAGYGARHVDTVAATKAMSPAPSISDPTPASHDLTAQAQALLVSAANPTHRFSRRGNFGERELFFKEIEQDGYGRVENSGLAPDGADTIRIVLSPKGEAFLIKAGVQVCRCPTRNGVPKPQTDHIKKCPDSDEHQQNEACEQTVCSGTEDVSGWSVERVSAEDPRTWMVHDRARTCEIAECECQ